MPDGPGQHESGFPRNPSGHKIVAVGLCLAALAFAPTLFYGFVYDDHNQIVANSHIQSWRYLPQYFTSHVWAHLYGAHPTELIRSYYRPLFLLWLRINYLLFGLVPAGWHLLSVAVHIGAAFLVFRFAKLVLEDSRAAAIAAVLFAVLPTQMESVAWVSGVTDPLMAVFMLLGYLAYAQSLRSPSRRIAYYAASLACYGAALLCKESAAILPAIIFAYALLFSPRRGSDSRWRRWLFAAGQSLPYIPVFLLYAAARGHALRGMVNATVSLSPAELFYTYPSVAWFYLRHALWPVNLALFYYVPTVHHPGLWEFWLPLVAVLGAAFVLWKISRKSRVLAFGVALFALHLIIPLVGFAFLGQTDRVHDRYLYLSSIGMALLIAEGWRRWSSHRIRNVRVATAAVAVLFVFYVGALAAQEPQWADDYALFTRAVEVSPTSASAHALLGQVLTGRSEYAQAWAQFDLVRKLQPENPCLATRNMALLHLKMGDYATADREFGSCPLTVPLMVAWGQTRLKMGQPKRALEPYRAALAMMPNDTNIRLDYASALIAARDLPAAVEQYKIVLAALPGEDVLRAHITLLEKQVAKCVPGEPCPPVPASVDGVRGR